jgi:arylsulfatase A-like enzyme
MKNKPYGSTILSASAAVFYLTLCSCSGEPEKPNIIFILTDDHRWDALGFAGNEIIQTPVMDDLARNGIYFANALVTSPVCAASLATILTGMYERTTTFTFQRGNIKDPYINLSYPALMKGKGYYTGFFGKFGVSYGGFNQLFDVGEIFKFEGNPKTYFNKTIGSDTVHLTRYTGQMAMDFIDSVPKDQPFCLSLSFSAPHAVDSRPEQFFWQKEYDSLYSDVTIPPALISEDKYFEMLPERLKIGENRARYFWRYDTPEKYQRMIKGYYRMITELDAEIGKIRNHLKDKGLDDKTIIIIMGDNGKFLGERQLAGKWTMHEQSLRVPLIIYDPRNPIHRRIDDLALNLDIAPTLLDYAGLAIPENYQGKSLAGYTRGENPLADREEFICEHLWEVTPPQKVIIDPSEGIRTKTWKYFRYVKNPEIEELYDLVNDPLEINNLAGSDEHQEKLKELRSRMIEMTDELVKQRLH